MAGFSTMCNSCLNGPLMAGTLGLVTAGLARVSHTLDLSSLPVPDKAHLVVAAKWKLPHGWFVYNVQHNVLQ